MNALISTTFSRCLLRRVRVTARQRSLQTASASLFTAARAKNVQSALISRKTALKNVIDYENTYARHRYFQTTRRYLDKNKSESKDDDDEEDRGFSLDSGNLVIGVQILPGKIPRWKVFIRFKDGIGSALTGQLLSLMTPVTMVGNLVVGGVTSVASGVSSVVSNTAGWLWGSSGDKKEQLTAEKQEMSALQNDGSREMEHDNKDISTSINDGITKEVPSPPLSLDDRVDNTSTKVSESSQSLVSDEGSDNKAATVKQDKDDKDSGWGLASTADWGLSFFIKKQGNKKKTEDDEDDHDEDDIHDKNSVKSVYSVWIPIYGTLYYTVSTPKEGKDKKYSYEELSYELDSVKHQATLEKLLSDKILIEEKAALVVYLLVDGLTKVPFAATISKKVAGFILSNLGKNVRSAYNWIADSEK